MNKQSWEVIMNKFFRLLFISLFLINSQVYAAQAEACSKESAVLVQERETLESVLTFGFFSLKNAKLGSDGEYNQDRAIITPLVTNKILLGVFDGHGPKGHVISEQVQKMLPLNLAMLFGKHGDNLEKALQEAKIELSNSIRSMIEEEGLKKKKKKKDIQKKKDLLWSGTTASTVVYNPEKKEVTISHVGDSRVVVMSQEGKVKFVTKDHQAKDQKEVERLRENSNNRFAVFQERVMGLLAVTRSIGDWNIVDQTFSQAPANKNSFASSEVKTIGVEKGDIVLLASDGLYDGVRAFLTSEKEKWNKGCTVPEEGVNQYIIEALMGEKEDGVSFFEIAEKLAKEAQRPEGEQGYFATLDDVTVLMAEIK